MSSIKPHGLQCPWMTLEGDISYCKLLDGQHFKIYCKCRTMNYIRPIRLQVCRSSFITSETL